MSLRSALPLFVFNKLGTRSISQISNLLKARHDLCRAQLTVASYNKHVLHIKVPAILVLTWMLRIASSSSKVSQLPIQRHHSAYGAVRWSNDFIFIEYRISKLSKRELIIGFWAQFKDNPVTEWRNLWIMNWARWSRELTVCSWCCSSTVYKKQVLYLYVHSRWHNARLVSPVDFFDLWSRSFGLPTCTADREICLLYCYIVLHDQSVSTRSFRSSRRSHDWGCQLQIQIIIYFITGIRNYYRSRFL